MMAREEVQKGFFVSFDYTGDALTEIDRYWRQTKRVIVPSPSARSSTNTSPTS